MVSWKGEFRSLSPGRLWRPGKIIFVLQKYILLDAWADCKFCLTLMSILNLIFSANWVDNKYFILG